MISDEAVARQISTMMLDISRQLDESIATVMDRCPEQEFKTYRRAAASVLAEIVEILNPLYRRHPELKPPEFD